MHQILATFHQVRTKRIHVICWHATEVAESTTLAMQEHADLKNSSRAPSHPEPQSLTSKTCAASR